MKEDIMATAAVHKERLTVRRGVAVLLAVLAIFVSAVVGVWTYIDLPVEYRTASAWVPAGVIQGDASGIPASHILLSDYKDHAQEFARHVVRATNEGLAYTGFQEGMPFPFQTSAELPRVPESPGFWYISIWSPDFGSLDVATGTVTYQWSTKEMVWTIIVALVLVGACILSVVCHLTFPQSHYNETWLSRPVLHGK